MHLYWKLDQLAKRFSDDSETEPIHDLDLDGQANAELIKKRGGERAQRMLLLPVSLLTQWYASPSSGAL